MDQVAIVYNPRSGALLSASEESPEELLTEQFRRRGVEPELRAFNPDTVAKDVRDLLAAEPDALVVAAGDGTVRAVAEQMIGEDIPLGILPCGTMNVLASDLGFPADLEPAFEALLVAKPRQIDVATVNGELFLCSSTLAMMPHLGRLRERARGSFGWRAVRVLGDALHLLFRYPRMRLTLVVDGVEHQVSTRATVVSSNPLSTKPLASKPAPMPGRERLDAGLLAAYVAQDRTNWDLLAVTAKLFDGSWQRDRRLRTYEGRTVLVQSPGEARMSVMNDGEIAELAIPLRYEIHPLALAVLAPQEPA